MEEDINLTEQVEGRKISVDINNVAEAICDRETSIKEKFAELWELVKGYSRGVEEYQISKKGELLQEPASDERVPEACGMNVLQKIVVLCNEIKNLQEEIEAIKEMKRIFLETDSEEGSDTDYTSEAEGRRIEVLGEGVYPSGEGDNVA